MGENILYRNPLLRLAIPLMLGIALGWACNVGTLYAVALFAFSVAAIFLGMMRIAPKWLFGVGVTVMMFSVGLFAERQQSACKAPQWDEGKHECLAQLVEVPAVRGTNIKVLASLSLSGDSLAERSNGLVYLYFPHTVEAEQLTAGDVIAFEGKILNPKNQGNPEEFNIEEYYYIKGITGTSFVPDGKWNIVSSGKKSVQTCALALRAKVISFYERLGFADERLALLSALTLGEKRDFPQELKENYSAAGASHILALSGLHLGILYMLLTFFFPVWGHKPVYRFLREIVVVTALWGFAFVAGLSPSVVRATILFMLISLGRLVGNDSSPLNSLSFAAIVMLLFSPHLLFDVSFQLSFAAVLSILLLVPYLQNLLEVHKRGVLYSYLMNLPILSLVAQLGTLPFVWYHFGVFPLYFLLTNLFVVPLSFVVMLLAVMVWLLSPIVFLARIAAYPLGWAVGVMNWGVCCLAALPGASFALPHLGLLGVTCVTLLTLFFVISLLRKRWWLLLLSSCTAILFVVIFLCAIKSDEEGDYMLIYNNHKNPLVHLVFDHGENYLISTIPQCDAEYEYVSTPYVKEKMLSTPQWVDWEYNDSLVQYYDGSFVFEGLSVKLLDNSHWRDNGKSVPVDLLVLCRGFLGRISELVEYYPASCVVVDGSLYKHSRERIKREYAELGVDVIDISQTGAVKILATDEGFDLISMCN